MHKAYYGAKEDPGTRVDRFTYDNDGKRILQVNTVAPQDYSTVLTFRYNTANDLIGYKSIKQYPVGTDTAISDLTFANGYLAKNVVSRYNDGNVNTFTDTRNAAGNPTYSLALGQYPVVLL